MQMETAIREAITHARGSNEEYFVVWSPEHHDRPGQHYHTCNQKELNTYFCGAKVVLSTADTYLVEGAKRKEAEEIADWQSTYEVFTR